ncbi:24521_t:CDS:2 [Dentiscutata erythropus]|uniref:24521_t:CDS:1 n=1 Tax=Dentiscutata erythropus TaxID=1348616 RepID=A0A9N9IED7_9GLOM|nr:24521_t:CDS:2 [Dentiscutata erythropus]
MLSTKHKSYTVKQKLEIISKSKETSNKAIAKIYGINHSQVSRSISSGRKAAYPLAEKALSQ